MSQRDDRQGVQQGRVGPDPVEAIRAAARREPYARKLGMECVEVGRGCCRVEMTLTHEMLNLFGTAHGGAVFSLIDEAFQIAGNSEGLTAYALNLSVTYVAAGRAGDRLVAEAREVAATRRTASYEIRVTRPSGEVVALAQALAYRTGGLPPFLQEESGPVQAGRD
ncbi:MAG: hotdog fold thioesterase [Deferrisomatales bacterium]|nr:hotdog fold thioesterase [Deferrisomatales bacterium]